MIEYPPTFSEAVKAVLEHEGGFVNDEDDPGGATNYGISLRFIRQELEGLEVAGIDMDKDADGDVDADDVRLLTREDAIHLYYTHFWKEYGYEQLPEGVGAKVFDLAVNMGPRPAHKHMQRAVRAAEGDNIADDGIIGPVTLQAVREVDEVALLASIRSEAAGFYRVLVAKRPKFKKYETGWLRRAYE